jgi:myo-inositol-1(or 4)-monophosphatase
LTAAPRQGTQSAADDGLSPSLISQAGTMLHSALINVMVKAARRAGRSLKRDLGEVENLQVSLKGPANFVTMADRRAEEMLHSDLTKARPGYGFIGEEGGAREGDDKTHTWIVDPLDGTTNFLHGIPQFAISIGLRREGTVIAGVIYNPANEELYTAERGKGAFLNDQRLRVAGRRKLNECVIACGLPHIGRGDHELSRLEMMEIQHKVAGLRRFGAASLDMAFVAAGRLDGYWERNLQSWDLAAGSIIVREAGGIVSCVDGESDPLSTGNVICGNEHVHAEMVKILRPLKT